MSGARTHKSIRRARSIQATRARANEGVARAGTWRRIARRAALSRTEADVEITPQRAAIVLRSQNPISTLIVLRCSVDDAGRERAANIEVAADRAVATDIETYARLLGRWVALEVIRAA